jgi:hypothetical protein
MLRNLRTKHGIGVGDDGEVDLKTVDIPYEARKAKMDIDREGIYKFGMGFDSSQVGDGNITNVVIKSRYGLLDIKCDKLEIRLKQYLGQIIDIVLDEINEKHGTEYTGADVRIEFEREIITNETDTANIAKTEADAQAVKVNTLLNVATQLPQETLMQKICEALDIDYEEIKDSLPLAGAAEGNAQEGGG